MFKIVLAGDAAVGKSCFIMRLCKGKFVSNLSSTLGRKHYKSLFVNFFSKSDIAYFRYIPIVGHVPWLTVLTFYH